MVASIVPDDVSPNNFRFVVIGVDMVVKGAVELHYIATDEQITNVLTKPLSRVKLEYFRDKLGVVPRKRERSWGDSLW
jgi:hypothetical protein